MATQDFPQATWSRTFEKDADWYKKNMPDEQASAESDQLGISKDNLFKMYEQWNKTAPFAVQGNSYGGQFAMGQPGAGAYDWIQNQVNTQKAQNILNPQPTQTPAPAQPDMSYLSSLGGGQAAAPTTPTTPTTPAATTPKQIPLGYNPYVSPLNQIGALSDLGVSPAAIQPLSGNFNLGQMSTPQTQISPQQRVSSLLTG